MANDQEKEAAARASLRFVKDGQVVGLGTGSTAAYFIKLLGEEVKKGLRVRGIPTSVRSQELALSLGIPLITLDECQEIAVTVDGADEVDPELRLIKGGGGALLREKIVASATKQMIVVADASKQVARLGKFPLPVEVIKFAQALVAKRIVAMGAQVELRVGPDGTRVERDAGSGGAWVVYRDGECGVVRARGRDCGVEAIGSAGPTAKPNFVSADSRWRLSPHRTAYGRRGANSAVEWTFAETCATVPHGGSNRCDYAAVRSSRHGSGTFGESL